MTVFRYVLNELGRMFLFIFFCLFLVVMLGFSMQQMHKIGGGLVILREILPFLMGFVAAYTAPVALLLATTVVYMRIARDNELIALQAAGYSKAYIARPALVLALLVSAGMLYVNNEIRPRNRYARHNLEVRELGTLLAASTRNQNSFHMKNTIFRYDSIRNGYLHNLHVVELTSEGAPSKWFAARRGRFLNLPTINDPFLEFQLEDVTVTYWSADQEERQSQVLRFEKQKPFLYRRNMREEMGMRKKKLEDMVIPELSTIAMKKNPPEPLKDYPLHRIQVELHKRFASSFAPVAFVLLCVPLAMLAGDRSRMGGVGMIVLPALVLFYPLQVLGNRIGETTSLIPPYLLFWPPHILFAVVGYFLTKRGN